MERYRKAKSNYHDAVKKTADAKADYKSGADSKVDIKAAKSQQKIAERALDKSYGQQ